MADNDFDRRTRRESDTGTRIHVEKDRGGPNWLWLLVPLILGLLVLPLFFNNTADRQATTMQQEQVAAITYDGRRYQPIGEARTIDPAQMVLVGQADNGQDVYGMREMAGGGGGQGTERLFTKDAAGRFQPLTAVE